MIKRHQLEKVKYINDPVYGGIGITELEWKIIDTPIFQRLRGLRQLARVNFVFPGAEHSRFAHSLGVLSNMGVMTDALLKRKEIKEEDVVKLRVAALLHDIGHYPLSHLGETAYGYGDSGNIIVSKKVEKKRIPLYELCCFRSKAASHERLGQYIVENNSQINQILLSYDLDPSEIGRIFCGDYQVGKLFCTQLIHSSLDADRLDYLLRDSFQTGVRYGMVDLQYLARLARVKKKDNDLVLAFDTKGKHVVEHFLMSRYFHYLQVVYHKTSIAFEGMIKALYIKLLQEDGFLFKNLDDIRNGINTEAFLNFTDSFLDTALFARYQKTSDEEYKLLYRMYRDRKRPKVVFERKELYLRDGNSSEKATVIKHILKTSPHRISDIIGSDRWGYSIIPFHIEGIRGKYKLSDKAAHEEELREAIQMFDSPNSLVSYLAEDDNSIMNMLSSYECEFIRIYVLDDIESEKKLKKIQNAILDLIP